MRTRRGAGRAHNHRLLTALCCILLYSAVCGENMIVQIAADSADSAALMVQKLTGQCDDGYGVLTDCMCDDPDNPGSPIACKFIFEVVEATTSFVQEVANLESFTLEEPPMLQIKTNVQFDSNSNNFLIEYESLPSEEYKRVLYFQAADATLDAGDAGNQCLVADNTVCWDELLDSSKYVLASNSADLPSDDADKAATLTQDFIEGDQNTGITIAVAGSGDPADSTQTISITLSLASVLSATGATALGTPGSTTTVDNNVINYYTIGIGMLFWYPTGSRSNMIIFDKFNLVEDSVNTWKVETVNQYTLARYASFQMIQTQAAQDEGRDASGNYGNTERAFMLELVVQTGFILASSTAISLSYKNPLTSEFTKIDQTDQQTLTDALQARFAADSSCFNPRDLTFGVPQSRTVNTQQVVTLLSAIPNDASVAYDEAQQPAFELSIAMQLCRNDGSGSCVESAGAKPVLSLLNFDSSVVPTPVCNAAISQTWSPIEFAQMSVYVTDQGTQKLGEPKECTAADCAALQLYNDAEGETTSHNLISSLMLIAIHPKDNTNARGYFDVSDNIAQLDQLYITHKKKTESTVDLTGTITNTPSTNADSRSTLTLDDILTGGNTAQCHLQTDTFTYTNQQCITTHDFDLTGPVARSISPGVDAFYVHELQYKGSGIVTDTAVDQQFSVSNTVDFSVSFILYLPVEMISLTQTGPVDFVITTHTDASSGNAVVVTFATINYHRHFVSLTGVGPWIITLPGTAPSGGVNTVITLTHDVALDTLVAADIDWLNNYYTADVQSEMLAFYQDVRAQLVSTDSASLYLVSPTYNWGGTLIGLVDQSLLSMSWSVSQAAAASSGARRRLLQVSDVSNSVSDEPDEKQYRRAKSMDELGTACSMYADTRDFPMPAWRDVLLRKLNCTEAPKICQAVQSCDDLTSPCVHAITDAARSLRLLVDWDAESQVNAPSTTNTTNTSVVDADQQYQETPAPFNVLDVFDVDAAVARASASVVIDGDFACQTALRHKAASKPPAVLNVPYDNAVPPPLQLEIIRPDGNSTCSLEALVQAMAPMQLLHASTHSAIFVAPHIARYMSPVPTQTPVNTQALFAAAHRAHDNSLPSATASAHLRQQRSFFTLPSAALKWLHDRPPVLHDTDRTRVALTCGATTYHEQIDFAKLAHTRRMRVDKKVRRPEVHLQELQDLQEMHAGAVGRDSASV